MKKTVDICRLDLEQTSVCSGNPWLASNNMYAEQNAAQGREVKALKLSSFPAYG